MSRQSRSLATVTLLVALAGCGTPLPPSLSHTRAGSVLVLPRGVGCTDTGWCRFPDRLPIDPEVVIATEHEIVLGGSVDGRAAIARWDGGGWHTTMLEGRFVTALADRGGELWAAGFGVAPRRLVGDRWVVEGNAPGTATTLALGGDDVFVTSDATVLYRGRAHDWRLAATPPLVPSVPSVTSDPSGGVYAILSPHRDETQVFAWHGATAQFVALDGPHPTDYVSAQSPDDVATIGAGPELAQRTIRRWNGRTWTETVIEANVLIRGFLHRGRELVVLGVRLNTGTSAVITIADGHVTTVVLPDDPGHLAVGPDGLLLACGGQSLWFHR